MALSLELAPIASEEAQQAPVVKDSWFEAAADPTSVAGTQCPKCDYVRKPTDNAPAWQCPHCGVVYAKVAHLKDRPAASADHQRTDLRHHAASRQSTETAIHSAPPDRKFLVYVIGLSLVLGFGGLGWVGWDRYQAKRMAADLELAAQRQREIDQAANNVGDAKKIKDLAYVVRQGRGGDVIEPLRPLADKGEPEAMMLLGLALSSGPKGLANLSDEARAWLLKAGQAGHHQAWVWLGYSAELQAEDAGHFERAVNYYMRAAREGNAAGLFSLAYATEQGLGMARNVPQAFTLYSLAREAFNRNPQATETSPAYRSGLGSAAAMMRLENQISPVDKQRAAEVAVTWQPGHALP